MCITTDAMSKLSGKNNNVFGRFWLSTDLLDFVVKYGLPPKTEDEIIVPSSTIHNLLTIYLRNAKIHKAFYEKKKIEYQKFSLKPATFIFLSCDDSHFIVLKLLFDPTNTSGKIFQNVEVYDSLKRSVRNKEKKVSKTSVEGIFLKRVQSFFSLYVLWGTAIEKKLNDDEYLILEGATIRECPSQMNTYDCGLYAVAVVLHLVNNVELNATTFNHSNIEKFRKHLHEIFDSPPIENMPDPKKMLSRSFIYSFFPKLNNPSSKPDPFLNYFMKNSDKGIEEELKESEEYLEENGTNATNSDDKEANQDVNVESGDGKNVEDSENGTETVAYTGDIINIATDEKFKAIFLDDPDLALDNLQQLDYMINEYENWSGFSLAIKKSEEARQYRNYRCVQHTECYFRANFGFRKKDCKYILRSYDLRHNGMDRGPFAKGGRKQKQRRKGIYNESIQSVLLVKSGEPNPQDIRKAAMNIQNQDPTYNQAYRALQEYKEEEMETAAIYQLLIPYLDEFKNRNPGSGVFYERDDEDRIDRFFVCPAVLANKLRFIRPVISLDACHLNSDAKGTLYIATGKSGNNELFPFAFTIASTNENKSGWKFFLGHLKTTCPLLSVPHVQLRCYPYSNFSFISDRDKGLLEAIKEVFPENHHMFCMEHLQRNVATNCGPLAAKCIKPMGTTYSVQEENKWWKQLKKNCPKAVEYIKNIDPECWRNTSWMKNNTLPPRYGIKNTNMSESANAMLFLARKGTWLDTTHLIVDFWTRRISSLHEEYNSREGVIPHFEDKLRVLYDESAAYQITRIDDHNYSVKKYDATIREHRESQLVNILTKSCTCGIWQDTELPCLEAMVFLRKMQNKNFQQILRENVSPFYTFWSLQNLYDENVNPVVINMLEPDEVTQPPVSTEKRQPGRPKNRRYRFRSIFANPFKDCPIICQKCGKRGHNKASCDIHTALETAAKKKAVEKKRAEKKAAQQNSAASVVASVPASTNLTENNEDNDEDVTEEEINLAMELLLKDPGFMKNIF